MVDWTVIKRLGICFPGWFINNQGEFVYAKAKIDEQIRAIVGDDLFKPWEERYG